MYQCIYVYDPQVNIYQYLIRAEMYKEFKIFHAADCVGAIINFLSKRFFRNVTGLLRRESTRCPAWNEHLFNLRRLFNYLQSLFSIEARYAVSFRTTFLWNVKPHHRNAQAVYINVQPCSRTRKLLLIQTSKRIDNTKANITPKVIARFWKYYKLWWWWNPCCRQLAWGMPACVFNWSSTFATFRCPLSFCT